MDTEGSDLGLTLHGSPPPSPYPTRTARSRAPTAETRSSLRRWIVCFATVNFNVDLGPDLQDTYPPTSFSPLLSSNIAFSSLPEGVTNVGALAYAWRIPIPPGEALELGAGGELGGEGVEGDGFLYGYVHFMQEKNERLKRGYSQRSLVLVTRRPNLTGLFSNTLSILGPLFVKFSNGTSNGAERVGDGANGILETACHNMARWPHLTPGTTVDLPFLGSVQSVAVPIDPTRPQWATASSPTSVPTTPTSLPLTPLSTFIHSNLTFSKLILLWELVLLGEPILIWSKDPRAGSELVIWLRGLVKPILAGGDYRPYFHIHDQDFSRLVNSSPPKQGLVLSITNPHILSQCSHWPHIIHLQPKSSGSTGGGLPAGLKTKRKRHVAKDEKVSKEVERAFAGGDYVGADELILRHLAMLTRQFLDPLDRYFATLSSISSSGIQPFQTTTFLATLYPSTSSSISQLSKNGDQSALVFKNAYPGRRFYERWLASPTFGSWLVEKSA